MLVLFDIDGTLVLTGGAGGRAFERACREVHGIDDALAGVDLGGMTDPALVELVFRARLGRAATAAEYDAVIEAYLAHLGPELEASNGYRVLPGVETALELCAARGALAGLATGNVERAARAKLARGGLDGRFSFGGYGCDATGGGDRAALVARGIERGRALAGRAVPAHEILVIGDTARDVAAARSCGVRAIAVATGSVPAPALAAAGAEVVLDTLDDLGTVLRN